MARLTKSEMSQAPTTDTPQSAHTTGSEASCREPTSTSRATATGSATTARRGIEATLSAAYAIAGCTGRRRRRRRACRPAPSHVDLPRDPRARELADDERRQEIRSELRRAVVPERPVSRHGVEERQHDERHGRGEGPHRHLGAVRDRLEDAGAQERRQRAEGATSAHESASAKVDHDGNSPRRFHDGRRICYVDPQRAHRSAYRTFLSNGGLFARWRGDGRGELSRLRHPPRPCGSGDLLRRSSRRPPLVETIRFEKRPPGPAAPRRRRIRGGRDAGIVRPSWTLAPGAAVTELRGHSDDATDVVGLPADRRRIVSVGLDRRVMVHDVEDPEPGRGSG